MKISKYVFGVVVAAQIITYIVFYVTEMNWETYKKESKKVSATIVGITKRVETNYRRSANISKRNYHDRNFANKKEVYDIKLKIEENVANPYMTVVASKMPSIREGGILTAYLKEDKNEIKVDGLNYGTVSKTFVHLVVLAGSVFLLIPLLSLSFLLQKMGGKEIGQLKG